MALTKKKLNYKMLAVLICFAVSLAVFAGMLMKPQKMQNASAETGDHWLELKGSTVTIKGLKGQGNFLTCFYILKGVYGDITSPDWVNMAGAPNSAATFARTPSDIIFDGQPNSQIKTFDLLDFNSVAGIPMGALEDGQTYTVMAHIASSTDKGMSKSFVFIYHASPRSVEAVAVLPPDPVKEGYTFKGWYMDAGLTIPYAGQPITGETQLYAKFEINKYTLTFNANGGSAVTNKTIDWNTKIASPTTTKAGYTFGGWYTESGLINKFDFNTAIKKNYNFYAKWTANTYTITYKDVGDIAFSGTHASGYPTSHTYDKSTTLKDPSKTGYTFEGWFTNSAGTGTKITELSATGYTANITLYAKWTIKHYTVNFEANGGTAVSPQTVDYNTKLIGVNTSREGYNFRGWFKDENFTADFDLINTPVTENMTLYAKFEIKIYKVTFYVEGTEYFSLNVAHGTVLAENKDIQQAMQLLKLENATEEEISAFWSTVIYGDTTISATTDESTLKAIKVIAWIINYYWVLITIGVVLFGGILYAVIRKKKKA